MFPSRQAHATRRPSSSPAPCRSRGCAWRGHALAYSRSSSGAGAPRSCRTTRRSLPLLWGFWFFCWGVRGAARRPGTPPGEDAWVEMSRVVDDDHDRRFRLELSSRIREHRRHVPHVGGYGSASGAPRGRSDLVNAPVLEVQELVGVPVLLVVVDEAGVRRRRDDAVRLTRQPDCPRVRVEHLHAPIPAGVERRHGSA